MTRYIFVTLLSSRTYIEGVLVLYRSLMKYGRTKYPFACVCSKSIEDHDICLLERNGIKCIRLSMATTGCLDLSFQTNMFSHWNNTFDKLLIWSLTEYDKIVLLDSDMIVMDNIDELFDKPAFSAVAAGQLMFGYDRLNSGLLVIEPNMEVCTQLLAQIPLTIANFFKENKPVGDQDIINDYIPNWRSRDDLHLHEGYNLFFSLMTRYHKDFDFSYENNIKVVHFIGPLLYKPWKNSLLKVVYHILKYSLHNNYGLKAYSLYQLLLLKTRVKNYLYRLMPDKEKKMQK